MEFEFDRMVDAPPGAVWAALTGPATMESHLPAGTTVTVTGPEKFRVSMKIPMGFLRPTVNVDIQLSDIRPQDSFDFEFSGKAMGAGIEGTARVSLGSVDGANAGPGPPTRVRISGSVHTSGLLKKVSDSKVEAAVTGFLDEYFTSVEREGHPA